MTQIFYRFMSKTGKGSEHRTRLQREQAVLWRKIKVLLLSFFLLGLMSCSVSDVLFGFHLYVASSQLHFGLTIGRFRRVFSLKGRFTDS